MKILFLNTHYSPNSFGGTEVVLQTLVEGIASKGNEVVVLSTADQKGLYKDEVNGIRVWRVGIRNLYCPVPTSHPPVLERRLWHLLDSYNLAMGRLLKTILDIEKPSVASVHNTAGWSVSAWTSLHDAGVPVVQVLHDHYLICPTSTMFKGGRNCGRQCLSCKILRLPHARLSQKLSAVVGVSRFILKRHQQMGFFKGVPGQSVIFNARKSADIFLKSTQGFRRQGEKKIRFGFIGSLFPGKGVEDLIQAYLRGSSDSSELWIAGAGDEKYERRLHELSAGSSVKFLGRMHPGDFYPNVDVVVVPSRWNEAFTMVVMEAMAFGKTVIAYAVGGIPELLKNGETGILVKPGDQEGLFRAMQQMVLNPELVVDLGLSASKNAESFLDHETFVERHLQIYGSVCSEK